MDKNDVRVLAMHALMIPEHQMVDSVARAILAERKRCNDTMQKAEVRLVAAYIRRAIESGQ